MAKNCLLALPSGELACLLDCTPPLEATVMVVGKHWLPEARSSQLSSSPQLVHAPTSEKKATK